MHILDEEQEIEEVNVMSSSMVFESTSVYPTPEGEQLKSPPPLSTYGFQKLACEYFAKGAWEQYKLPYTIIRPFNCIGIGEKRALCDKEIMSGNVKLAMSHVVPDLVQKVLKGQDPLHILGSGEFDWPGAEREFNRRAGFTSAHDRLPEWLTREKLPPFEAVFDVPEEDLDNIFIGNS
jgi:nucleoside-diphosphate-sugar epimerase